ncbi:SWI/SNF complex subunit SWI3B [Nymphaea colorata]|nr:SWI/SNF complex subunit SWI3B [Nymphaea colorata]
MDAASTPEKPPPPPETSLTPETALTPESAGEPERKPLEQKEPSAPRTTRPPDAAVSGVDRVTVPSYGRWFSFDRIHDTERRMLAEFFDGRSTAKNPRVYMYLRDFIVKKYRENPSRKITFTEVRRMLVADVGSIRRVFDFLESWGLINYTPSKQSLRLEEKEKTSVPVLASPGAASSPAMMSESARLSRFFNPTVSGEITMDAGRNIKDGTKKLCSGCKSPCSNTCFDCRKADVVLCTRCFIRGNYQFGLSGADFKRIDLTVAQETRTGWSDAETLRLLEAILQYNDDWRMVSDHVGSRTEKECIARFIKLPIGEQYIEPLNIQDDKEPAIGEENGERNGVNPTKRRRLTPLADATNPIMAQAAFLSALVGSDVASAAAHAAVAAIYDDRPYSQDTAAERNGVARALEDASAQAHAQLDQEEMDVERAITNIIEVKLKGIRDKIMRFEEQELQTEKERMQLDHMKGLLFADQLNFLQRSSHARSTDTSKPESAKIATDVT